MGLCESGMCEGGMCEGVWVGKEGSEEKFGRARGCGSTQLKGGACIYHVSLFALGWLCEWGEEWDVSERERMGGGYRLCE